MKKNFLKLSLMAVCGLIVFNACNSEELTENDPKEGFAIVEDNPYVLDQETVLFETASFIQSMNSHNPNLRSKNVGAIDYDLKVKKVKTMLTEKSSLSKQVVQEIPVYIVQYKNQANESAGYTVTIGDDRFNDKVIVFNDQGEFDDFDNNEFWKERIEGYIYNTVNSNNADEKISLRASDIPVFFYYFLDDWATSWHYRGKPYAEYTPFRGIGSSRGRAAAGCTAEAMAEIMAYHVWPRYGAYERYDQDNGVKRKVETIYTSANWSEINNNSYYNYQIPTKPVLREHISNLFAEIAYKLNTNFVSTTEAYGFPDNVPAVFRQMGYNCGSYRRIADYSDYCCEEIRKEIVEYKRPVYMAGWKSVGGGHAYILTGVMTNGTQSGQDLKSVAYYYVNNGNAGSGNGWYQIDLFKNPTAFDKDENRGNTFGIYPYRYRCGIITGIYPNLNNWGSTDLYRVNTYYPY